MSSATESNQVSDEIVRRSLDRYSAITIGAVHTYPFLARGIYAMTPVPVPGLRKMCGGWAMDKYGRCYFDPEMVLGIGGEQYSLKTLIADFIHEVWHFLRQHPDRFENLALPVGVVRDHKRWNLAADAEINGSDQFLRDNLQEWCVFPEKMKDKRGRPLDSPCVSPTRVGPGNRESRTTSLPDSLRSKASPCGKTLPRRF